MKINKYFLTISIVIFILIFTFPVSADPPTPHAVAGYIYSSGTIQAPLGTNFMINNTVIMQIYVSQTSVPVPGQSGRYSVVINGTDGDSMITSAWNSTHFGLTNFILTGVMDGINVTLNITRIEQNVTITTPSSNSEQVIGIPFDVSADIEAIGGGSSQNCNITLTLSNTEAFALGDSETYMHTVPTINLGTNVSETWSIVGITKGSTNITVSSICNGQTYGSTDNQDIITNLTISNDYPKIETIYLESITLNPGTTKTVLCNGTINDSNGYSSVSTVTGVIYSSTSTNSSSSDNNNNYKDSDCKSATFNADGKFECSFSVQFFAEPDTWTCFVNATDSLGLSNVSTNTSTLSELLAIGIESTAVDFGFLATGADSGTDDTTVIVQNLGNIAMDINLDSYDTLIGSDNAMNCSVGFIPTANVRYNLTQNIDYSLKTYIPGIGSITDNSFNLAKQTGSLATTPTTKSIYWGAGVPGSGTSGSCSGKILFTAVTDS